MISIKSLKIGDKVLLKSLLSKGWFTAEVFSISTDYFRARGESAELFHFTVSEDSYHMTNGFKI